MKVIVTGAAGLIGSNLCLELEKQGHKVIAIDNLQSGTIHNLKNFKGTFMTTDIRSLDWYERFEHIDMVYHLAAISDTRVSDETKLMTINYDAFRKIADYCNHQAIRLVYASSAAVYGTGTSPMVETANTNPLNIYGVSKLFMENYVEGMNSIGLRYFNVYGYGEFHKRDYANMITQMILKMKKNLSIKLFNDGEQKRDQVYVKDAVRATILAGESDYDGVVNVGTGTPISFNRIYSILANELNSSSEIIYVRNPYNFYQNHTEADMSLAKKEIGFVPKWKFEEGVRDYLELLAEEDYEKFKKI